MTSRTGHLSDHEIFIISAGRALRRYRLERLSRSSWTLAWGMVGSLLIWVVLGVFIPWGWTLLVAAGITTLAIGLAAAMIYFLPVPLDHLYRRMDQQAKLPDAVLSTGNWFGMEADPWKARQRQQTARWLEKIDWRMVWPVAWPKLLYAPGLSSVLALALLLWVVELNLAQLKQAALLAAKENPVLTAENLQPLDLIFKDWEEAQKVAPSPELEKMLEELKPLREEMANGQLTQKELLLKLNQVQARLQAEQARLEASSLDPLSQAMADALQNIDGLSALSADLQRKDFGAASDSAAAAAEKIKSGDMKMPDGEQAQTAADKLGEIAKQAGQRDTAAGDSLQKMQQALQQHDGSKMSEGLAGLKEALSRQGERKNQGRCLSTQLGQLAQAKAGMCQSQGTSLGPSLLSLVKSQQAGHGAGRTTDPSRVGSATQLDANHQKVDLTGNPGQGASETTTEHTSNPQAEQATRDSTQMSFSDYQKMAEEATEDENLPATDRQMIKRYFENIRPASNQ